QPTNRSNDCEGNLDGAVYPGIPLCDDNRANCFPSVSTGNVELINGGGWQPPPSVRNQGVMVTKGGGRICTYRRKHHVSDRERPRTPATIALRSSRPYPLARSPGVTSTSGVCSPPPA